MLEFVVVSEADLAQQIETQQCEHDDPDRQIDLTVEQPPVVGLVGHTQELETEGDLDKTENDLHGTEPTAALGQVFQQGGKKAKIVKGRAKASEKANIVTMGTQNSPAVERIRTLPTIGPVQENDTNTSVRAMKKIPIKPPLSACRSLLLTIQARKRDLEGPEERCGENHEHDEEDQVGKPVRSQPVEDVGRHGIAAHQTRNQNDRRNGKRIERYDEETVHRSLETSRSRRSAAFIKNDTVIGTIGNTQGVSSAAKPQRTASIIRPHRVLDSPAPSPETG